MGGVKGDVFAGVNRGGGGRKMDGRRWTVGISWMGVLCSDMAGGTASQGAKMGSFRKKS